MSEDHFGARIVLISRLTDDGSMPAPSGMGVLLTETLVLTCAHVVAAAADHDPSATERPRRGVLVRPALAQFGPTDVATATVADKGWFPKRPIRRRDVPSDVALLEVVRGQLITGAVPPLALSAAVSPSGAEGALLGLVAAEPEAELMPMHGCVGDAKRDGFYAFERHPSSDYWIEPGCSGAPVRSLPDSSLLGLVVQQDEQRHTAFLLPARDIRSALAHAGLPVAGRYAGMLALLQMWTDSAFGAAAAQAEKIKRLIQLYAGSDSSKPSPFVGRGIELRQISDWISQVTGTFFIGGRAGMGKSALLLHAAAALLQERPSVRLLMLPISLRFGTADEAEGLAVLAAQMMALFPSLRAHGRANDPFTCRSVIAAGWYEIRSRYRDRFVLLVDAIDEALQPWIEHGVLPAELPDNLVVVVTGRTATNEVEMPLWIQSLCNSGDASGRQIALAPLSQDAVAEALDQLGFTVPRGAGRNDILAELYRLSDQGDPLLVSLWSRLLADAPGKPLRSIASLRSLQKGISGLLEEWFKQQSTVWKSRGLHYVRREVEPLLQLLAVAEGPMAPSDVCTMLASSGTLGPWSEAAVEDLFSSSSRIVVDAGGGACTLVHPRLRYHYADLLQQAGQLHARKAAFVAWGRQQIAGLADEKGGCDLSTYVLENHASHLQTLADSADHSLLLDAVEELLHCRLWPQRWLAHHGSYTHYVADLQKLESMLAGSTHVRAASLRLRCQLSQKSISSMGENVPPAVLAALLRSDAWSCSRVHGFAKSVLDERRRVEALATILPFADSAMRHTVIAELLFDAPPATEPARRVAVLERVLGYSFERREAVVADAYACAMAITSPSEQISALVRVAPHLRPKERADALLLATHLAAGEGSELSRAAKLSSIAAACGSDEVSLSNVARELGRFESTHAFRRLCAALTSGRTLGANVWRTAFDITSSLDDQPTACDCVIALVDAASMPVEAAEAAADFAQSIIDSRLRLRFLFELGRRHPPLREAVLERLRPVLFGHAPEADTVRMAAVASAWAGDGVEMRDRVLEILCRMGHGWGDGQAALALIQAAEGGDGLARRCLPLVAAILDADALQPFVLAMAVALEDARAQDELLTCVLALPERPRAARALAAIALALPDRSGGLLDEAIRRAEGIDHLPTRCLTLRALATGHAEPARARLLAPAVASAARIGERDERIRTLGKMAAECGDLPEIAEAIFDVAVTIDDQGHAASLLLRLAVARSEEHRTAEIARMLAFLPFIRDESQKGWILAELATDLPRTELDCRMTLEFIRQHSRDAHVADALVNLARKIGKFKACAATLIEVMHELPPTSHLFAICQQVYEQLGHRRDLLSLVLQGIEGDRVAPQTKAMCIAILEGVPKVMERLLRHAFFADLEVLADALDVLAGNRDNARTTASRIERTLEQTPWEEVREDQTVLLAAMAWRLSAWPDTRELASHCLGKARPPFADMVSRFVAGSFESIGVGNQVLRLTHPALEALAQPTQGADRVAASCDGGRNDDVDLDMLLKRYRIPEMLRLGNDDWLNELGATQTRIAAFRAVYSAVGECRSPEDDQLLRCCADAVEAG